MAVRIRDRAIRRTGELLKQIPPGKTGPKPELGDGADSQFSRKEAAEQAGTSHQRPLAAIGVDTSIINH